MDQNKFALSLLLMLCSIVAMAWAGDCRVEISGPRLVYLHCQSDYTIVLRCNSPMQQVKIVFSPGECMEYISSSPQAIYMPPAKQAASLVWEFREITAKSTELKVVMRATKRGTSSNVVAVTCDSVACAQAQVETKVMGVPALHVGSYDTEDQITIGKATIYVIEMRNEGTSAVTNTRMEHVLPKLLEFVEATGPTAFRHENGKVVFEPVAILHPGDKLTYKVKVKAIKSGVAIGRSLVTYDQFESPLGFDEATSVGNSLPAMHSSSYDTEDPLMVGYSTVYVMELRNEGTVPCNNLKVTDIIPEQTEFTGAEGPVAYRYENGRVVFESVPVLQPGDKLTYRVKVKAVKAGSAKNAALWTCDQIPEEVREEEGTSVYQPR